MISTKGTANNRVLVLSDGDPVGATTSDPGTGWLKYNPSTNQVEISNNSGAWSAVGAGAPVGGAPFQNVIRVDSTYGNDGTGSNDWHLPFKTVGAAVAAAIATGGGTILLGSGAFPEDIVIPPTSGISIVLRAIDYASIHSLVVNAGIGPTDYVSVRLEKVAIKEDGVAHMTPPLMVLPALGSVQVSIQDGYIQTGAISAYGGPVVDFCAAGGKSPGAEWRLELEDSEIRNEGPMVGAALVATETSLRLDGDLRGFGATALLATDCDTEVQMGSFQVSGIYPSPGAAIELYDTGAGVTNLMMIMANIEVPAGTDLIYSLGSIQVFIALAMMDNGGGAGAINIPSAALAMGMLIMPSPTDYLPPIVAATIKRLASSATMGWNQRQFGTGAHTITSTDYLLRCDTSIGPVTLNLPAANSTVAACPFLVKDEGFNASVNNIIINATGGDSIEGGASITLSIDGASTELYSDGAGAYFTV